MAVDVVLQKTHILDKKQVWSAAGVHPLGCCWCTVLIASFSFHQIDPKRAIPKDQQPSSSSPAAPPPRGPAAHGGGGGGGSPRDGHKVFVGGIHIEADENDLKEFFSRYDQVLQTVLMRDRDTGRSRGFGFVTLATLEGAQRACADTEASIRRRRVEIKMAVPRARGSGGGAGSRHSEGLVTSPGNSSADPYAAWAEYFKQNPEYYEAMMKAYSDPAAMAAYYNQYYGQSGAPGGGDVPGYPAQTDASSGGGSGAYEAALEQSNNPSEHYALEAEAHREDGHGYAEDSGRGYERDRRRTFRSRSRSASPRRGRSRSRSPPPRHYRERNVPDSYRGRRGFPGNSRGQDRDRRPHDRRERDRRGGPGERAFEHDYSRAEPIWAPAMGGEERGGHRYEDYPGEDVAHPPPPRAYQQTYGGEALGGYKEGGRE